MCWKFMNILIQFKINMLAVYTFLFVVMQTFFYGYGNYQGGEQGMRCALDFGRVGICIHIERCPEAIIQIRRRGHPQICCFEGIYPVVCCETKAPIILPDQGESIARKKCNEYTVTTTSSITSPLSPAPLIDTVAIGGEDAFPLEFPHMAILGYGNSDDVKWRCGGSLISERFVLTAAHCINTRLGNVQYVKLGVHQLNLTSAYEQAFAVRNVYKHPEYVRFQDYHDVALIELDRSADIQSGVKPACLNTLNNLNDPTLVATGWGAVELHGDIYNTLQKVYLSHVPTEICQQYYYGQRRLNNGVIGDWQICADGGGNRADTCQGDSGGPLQIKLNDDSLHTIVGITSFGIQCAIVPGVYTRVSHYVPWIESVVWPGE